MAISRTHIAITFTAAALVAATVPFSAPPDRLFLINETASVPRGVYVRQERLPVIGDYVTIRAAHVAPDYVELRPGENVDATFIKQVAAVAGAPVCTHGSVVLVDGHRLRRWEQDRQGRSLPWWNGCRRLDEDELFVLGQDPSSFDSRYWGPTRLHLVEGNWRPMIVERPGHEDGVKRTLDRLSGGTCSRAVLRHRDACT